MTRVLNMPQQSAPALSAEQMRLVLEVARLLAVTSDLDDLLRQIARSATDLLAADRASIFLHDRASNELWTKVALGLGTREIRVPCTAGIVGHVFKSGELLEVPDAYLDERFNRDVDRRNNYRTRNLLTAPMLNLERRVIGVVQVINRLEGDFSPTDHAMIQLLADQAGVAIQRWSLQCEVVKAESLRHEMDLAQKVQAAMIPEHPPKIPGLKCVGWNRSASVTGGDAYDLWEMGDGRLGVFVGDASGHGIAPAIVVSQARTLIRALAEVNCDPRWLLERVNARLSQDLEPGRFVTAFMGCVSPEGHLHWSSAGHGPILLRRSKDSPIEVLEPTGPPVGVIADPLFDESEPIELGESGMLLVMSDGIFEARSPADELMEIERIMALMNEAGGDVPADVLLTKIKDFVRAWQGKEEPIDDQTVVIVQRGAIACG